MSFNATPGEMQSELQRFENRSLDSLIVEREYWLWYGADYQFGGRSMRRRAFA